jgi:hypothetical protein
LGQKRARLEGRGGNYIMRSFIICTDHQIFIRVIKLRKMRLAGYVAHMGERRDAYRALVGKS